MGNKQTKNESKHRLFTKPILYVTEVSLDYGRNIDIKEIFVPIGYKGAKCSFIVNYYINTNFFMNDEPRLKENVIFDEIDVSQQLVDSCVTAVLAKSIVEKEVKALIQAGRTTKLIIDDSAM